MALERIKCIGHGQLELNQVAFPRDGRIEAQCTLDNTDFLARGEENGGKILCEAGMLLAIDKVNGKIKKPGEGSTMYALNYSSEHIYDPEHPELRNFCQYAQPKEALTEGWSGIHAIWPGYDFAPRMGFLAVGDRFTTNCLAWDAEAPGGINEQAGDDVFAKLQDALKNNVVIYGRPCALGAIELTKEVPTTAVVLQVVKVYTMPDGQPAVKFMVVKA